MVDIALQAERSGVDLASILKPGNGSTSNTTAPSPGRKMDAKARELGQVQLEACQMVMDDCYDNAIRPLVEELENKIFAGDSSAAEQGGFAPYKRFSKDGAELIASCRKVIDKAVTQLQAQLEVIQFASVNGGRPVSSVEFSKLTVDMRPVRHLVAEAFRELHATADRNLERLWIQHKAVIRDCYVDRFEQSFEKLIAGSNSFNRTTKALTRKTYRECEEQIRHALPRNLGPGRTVQLDYAQDMEELKHALMATISSRRRQSGLDDLMSYFNKIGEEGRAFSRLWWKNIAIRSLVMYYQVCQSAWAYRKARGIPYPPRFSRVWWAALLLPWRVGRPDPAPPAKHKPNK